MINQSLWEKALGILGSIRFWILALTAILAILNGEPVLMVLQVFFAAVAGLGTLDSVASRFAGTKV
jgi:hypothetical protein